jgi:predicted nucleotidyltransferase
MKTVYKCYVGSKGHGLYMTEEEYNEYATCDIDVMEFFAYDLSFYLSTHSLLTPNNELTSSIIDGEYDIVKHEIRKAIDLLTKGNPNMLVCLFGDDSMVLELSEGGRMLRDQRDMFLSKNNIRDRFTGYAYSQLARLERGIYNGYMGEKRKKLVDRLGYDTKNAMTLIRLMNEAVEVLQTGNITVDKRVNGTRQYYLDIKCGKWSLEKVKHEAVRLEEEVNKLYSKSILPETLDLGAIQELSYQILRSEVLR